MCREYLDDLIEARKRVHYIADAIAIIVILASVIALAVALA